MSIWFKLGKKYLHKCLSSLSNAFNITKQGITMKMSASMNYTIFLNLLYFSAMLSIAPEKCSKYLFFYGSQKYVNPFSHDFSYSIKDSTKSLLFLNWGSTISMFLSYFLSKFLKLLKEPLIFYARSRIAFDCYLVILLSIPSVSHRIEWSRSSLPFPE